MNKLRASYISTRHQQSSPLVITTHLSLQCKESPLLVSDHPHKHISTPHHRSGQTQNNVNDSQNDFSEEDLSFPLSWYLADFEGPLESRDVTIHIHTHVSTPHYKVRANSKQRARLPERFLRGRPIFSAELVSGGFRGPCGILGKYGRRKKKKMINMAAGYYCRQSFNVYDTGHHFLL